MTRNVAVVGLDDLNGRYLHDHLRDTEDVVFHAALDREETIIHADGFPFAERLALARRRIEAIPGGVDGVVTYWDFPSTSLTAFLAEQLDLPYISPACDTLCEHKFWCREEQAKVIDTPRFAGFSPFADDPLAEIGLAYPFWIKPVVGHTSMLGFEIASDEDFSAALAEIRADIEALTQPFHYVLENVDLPRHIAEQGPTMCIAEEIISRGRQFTLEGYVRGGQVTIHGIVESVRTENEHTFSHFLYPAKLPAGVGERMTDISARVLRQFGYEGCPFNIEFFYDETSDRISLLEINSRISQSHSEIFRKVDGQPNQQIAVDLALDREPRWQTGAGEFDVAAKFFLRHWNNARVTGVPGDDAFRRLARELPDVEVVLAVQPGTELEDLEEQESYSYEIGDVFIGAHSEQQLLEKFEQCKRILTFEFQEM